MIVVIIKYSHQKSTKGQFVYSSVLDLQSFRCSFAKAESLDILLEADFIVLEDGGGYSPTFPLTADPPPIVEPTHPDICFPGSTTAEPRHVTSWLGQILPRKTSGEGVSFRLKKRYMKNMVFASLASCFSTLSQEEMMLKAATRITETPAQSPDIIKQLNKPQQVLVSGLLIKEEK